MTVPHARATASVSLVAFMLRMAWALAARIPPAWDGVLYERGARGLARGLGYTCFMFGPGANPSVPTAFYPVGYPAYLAVFYRVLGIAPWVVALAGSLAGAVTVALVHRLALRIASPRAAGLAATTLAVLPGQVIFASTPMTEALWGCLLMLAVWALSYPALPHRAIALASFALAAATYVRPQAALLTPWLMVVPPGAWRQRLARAVVGSIVVALCVAPWTVRNCIALDHCAFVSTNGGSNLAIGAIPHATGTYLLLTPHDGCVGVVGEVSRDRCWRTVAVASIYRSPRRWLRLSITKVYHSLAYENFPASYLSRAVPQRINAVTESRLAEFFTLTWKALCFFAMVSLAPVWRWRSLGVPGALCVMASVGVVATHAVFFGGDRYHLPITGFVVVIAAGAFRGARSPRALTNA